MQCAVVKGRTCPRSSCTRPPTRWRPPPMQRRPRPVAKPWTLRMRSGACRHCRHSHYSCGDRSHTRHCYSFRYCTTREIVSPQWPGMCATGSSCRMASPAIADAVNLPTPAPRSPFLLRHLSSGRGIAATGARRPWLGIVYLDGNSLGPLPVGVQERVASVITQEWGKDLITSWSEDRAPTPACRTPPACSGGGRERRAAAEASGHPQN